MKKGLIVLIVFVVVALMLGNSLISRRNQMAVEREAVNAAWAQVDVVLQRRADLIPNLVETVKGFAAQEKTCSEISQRRVPPCLERILQLKKSRRTDNWIPPWGACS